MHWSRMRRSSEQSIFGSRAMMCLSGSCVRTCRHLTGIDRWVFNHPSLWHSTVAAIVSFNMIDSWSGKFYPCNIIQKYRHLWPLDWKILVLVGPSPYTNRGAHAKWEMFFFVYHLIQDSSMASIWAAAHMLSHSFTPAYVGWDWVCEEPHQEAMTYVGRKMVQYMSHLQSLALSSRISYLSRP